MSDYKPVTLTFRSKGLDIRSAGDEIALDQFASFSNLTSDREGAVRTILGRTALNATPITGTDWHTLAKLYTPVPYRYAGVDDKLHRAPVSPFTSYTQILPGATNKRGTAYQVGDMVVPTTPNGHCYFCAVAGTTDGSTEPPWPTLTQKEVTDGTCIWKENNFSGDPMFSASYPPGSSTNAWVFFANKNLMIKDNGTGSPVLWGVVPPATAPTAVANAVSHTLVEGFQNATPSTYWTLTDPSSVTSLSRNPAVYTGPNGNFSLQTTLSAAGTATIALNTTFNLNLVGGAASTANDIFNLYINMDVPANFSGGLLQFSIGDTTFKEYYQANILATFINTTGMIWTQLRFRRSDFVKTAAPGSSNDWSGVKAIKITVTASGPINIYLDDLDVDGGPGLNGVNYQWVYQYRNANTNEKSGISPLSAILGSAIVNQPVTLSLIPSQDPQVTNIDVFRIGGTVTSLAQVNTTITAIVNDPSVATIAFIDNVPDTSLGAAPQIDDLRPPNSTGVEFHLDRLWTWGGVGDAANILRFSKKVDVEHFPATNYIYVGDASESIIRVVAYDDQTLWVFTLSDAYRIIGTDESSFLAMKTSYGRGMINNPFALVVTPSRIFHTHYDGIYEFPSGAKVSQPIDGIFHGQTINSIQPFNSSAAGRLRMGFGDNKLYVFYPSDSSAVSNATAVFDTLYQRWNQSTIMGRSLMFEKDTSILVMGTTDGYLYQLESGTTNNGNGIPFTLNTGFQHLGVPDQDKRWGDLALDIDTNGQNVSVQLLFNNGDTVDTIQTVSCSGRKQLQIPINNGDSITAINAQLSISSTGVTLPVTIWKAIYRVTIEPPRRRSFVTDWDDDGSPGRKHYRTIVLDIDTMGNLVNVALEVDGSSTPVQTFSNIVTSGRKIVFLGISADTTGTKSRLKFSQVNDSTTAVLKVYASKIETIPQPDIPLIWQTDWSDNGYPYEKYWKEVLLEIDTNGATATVQFQLDNATVQTFTVLAAGRRRITTSLNADLIGKLGRVIITSSLPIALWETKFIVEPEPPDVTLADSYSLTLGYDRFKVIKRMWLALKANAAIAYTISADSVIRASGTITITNPPTGWIKIAVDLPATIKGKLIQLVLSSSASFKIYWQDSELEWRPVNGERSYQRFKFQPPKLS